MKIVRILDKTTGRLSATLPVGLQGKNGTPTPQDYEAEAWQWAVDAKLVDPKRKAEYSYQIADAPKAVG